MPNWDNVTFKLLSHLRFYAFLCRISRQVLLRCRHSERKWKCIKYEFNAGVPIFWQVNSMAWHSSIVRLQTDCSVAAQSRWVNETTFCVCLKLRKLIKISPTELVWCVEMSLDFCIGKLSECCFYGVRPIVHKKGCKACFNWNKCWGKEKEKVPVLG